MPALARFLRLFSIAACLIIALSWMMFAAGEIGAASEGQQALIENPSGQPQEQPTTGKTSDKTESGPRGWINKADNALIGPFDGVAESFDNHWVRRSIPSLLGLLLYGMLFGYLARMIETRSHD